MTRPNRTDQSRWASEVVPVRGEVPQPRDPHASEPPAHSAQVQLVPQVQLGVGGCAGLTTSVPVVGTG